MAFYAAGVGDRNNLVVERCSRVRIRWRVYVTVEVGKVENRCLCAFGKCSMMFRDESCSDGVRGMKRVFLGMKSVIGEVGVWIVRAVEDGGGRGREYGV